MFLGFVPRKGSERTRLLAALREIDGDPEAQLGVRYAAMQMIAVCPPPGVDASIAAKGLSGSGYKGHVFWDTEIFLLPACAPAEMP